MFQILIDRSQFLRTARVKKGGFRVGLGRRCFVTLGRRDFIVTFGVGPWEEGVSSKLGGKD
jgi:hypothetical protein